MLNYLKKISSVNNLFTEKPLSGQIATLLILMMAALLIFILVTVNIGQLSLNSTTLSNTADNCALSLASQLSTKANTYRQALKDSDAKYTGDDPPRIKGKGGILGVLLAVVCAVVSAIIFYFTGPAGIQAVEYLWIVVLSAFSGAIGSMIVSDPATPLWESALCGAIQGALIGVAIAGVATTIIGPGEFVLTGGGVAQGTVSTLPGTVNVATTPVLAEGIGGNFLITYAPGAIIPQGTVIVSGSVAPVMVSGVAATAAIATPVTYPAGQTVPAGAKVIAGEVACAAPFAKAGFDMALLSAGNLYQAGQMNKISRNVSRDLIKQLKTLPTPEDTVCEGVVTQAMMAVVDDPNKTTVDLCVDCNGDGVVTCGGDPCDSDNDGDIKETVPYFQYWRHRRTLKFKSIAEDLRKAADGFINGPLAKFADFCQAQWTSQGGNADSIGLLCREDIDGALEDGRVVQTAKALSDLGRQYQPFFYKPGTPVQQNDAEITEKGRISWDEIDLVKSDLKDFVETARSMRDMPVDQLASSWRQWINWFEKDDNDKECGGLYELLYTLVEGRDINNDGINDVKGLKLWMEELRDKRNKLPDCIYQDDEAVNSPCQDSCAGAVLPGQDCFATINADMQDEFKQTINAVDKLISAIETFLAACDDYRGAMEEIYRDVGNLPESDKNFYFGGINPVTYKWVDSRGENRVIVEVNRSSGIKIPWLHRETKPCDGSRIIGEDVCQNIYLTLRDYCDNCLGCDDVSRDTSVRITRKYPVSEVISGSQVLGIAGIYDNYDPLDDELIGKDEAKKDGFFSISKQARAYYSWDKVGLLKE